jgi:hypothetical protein
MKIYFILTGICLGLFSCSKRSENYKEKPDTIIEKKKTDKPKHKPRKVFIPLIKFLIMESKTDVAILAHKSGLLAVGADGKFKKLLVKGDVKSCLVDTKSGVVWFVKKSVTGYSLFYLDLLKKQKIVEILKNYPLQKNGDVFPLGLKNDDDDIFTFNHENTVEAVIIKLTKKSVKLLFKNKNSTLLNQNMLSVLQKRGENRLAFQKWEQPDFPDSPAVPEDDCGFSEDEKDLCGRLYGIPYTKLWISNVGRNIKGCKGVEKFVFNIYDPATKEFISIGDKLEKSKKYNAFHKSCGFQGGIVSPGGKAIFTNGKIWNLKKGIVFKGGKELNGGWINGRKINYSF